VNSTIAVAVKAEPLDVREKTVEFGKKRRYKKIELRRYCEYIGENTIYN
jgi:hypothetical protein